MHINHFNFQVLTISLGQTIKLSRETRGRMEGGRKSCSRDRMEGREGRRETSINFSGMSDSFNFCAQVGDLSQNSR